MAASRVMSGVEPPPFQALLDAHGRDVHRFLIALVGRTDADDCYQETWLSALRAYPRLREAPNLRGWVMTIAHRKAMDHLRATRRRAVPAAELPEGELPEAAAPDPVLAREDDVWGRVAVLPPKQRAAVALRFLADASYAEVAAVMETSEEAARRNVFEALKHLRREMAA